MSQTVQVPLTGEFVTPPADTPAQPQPAQEQPERESGFVNGQYVPPSKRVGLHQTRLGVALAKHTEAKAPTPQPSQAEALREQVATLRTAVNALAANQIGAGAPQSYGAPQQDAGTLEELRLHNRYGSGP